MNEEQYTELQLLEAIFKGGNDRKSALQYLFKHKHYRDTVNQIVLNGGGNDGYGKTIFKNCLIQLDKIVRRKKFTYKTLSQFFEQEARLAWCRELVVNSKARDYVLTQLTVDSELKAKIHHTVLKNSGTRDDASDTYQNGLMLINDHMKEGKFRGGAVKGFFYQVCYNLWRNELKRTKAISLPDDGFDLSVNTIDPQKELERKEKANLLHKIFGLLGESCQKILKLKFFIADQYNMEEIAEKMEFKNAQIASNTLSKCRKQLMELLLQHKSTFEWKINM